MTHTYKYSSSKVSRFKRLSVNKQTDIRTTLPIDLPSRLTRSVIIIAYLETLARCYIAWRRLKQVVLMLIHDLLFLPISIIESAVGKRLITHCCVSRLACSRLSGHIKPHSPDFKHEINTTTTIMN